MVHKTSKIAGQTSLIVYIIDDVIYTTTEVLL
jgi:hypothetical protein